MKMPWSKPASRDAEPEAAATPTALVDDAPRLANSPKGRPTPKRPSSRRPVAPPPVTGKEARQRMREKNQERKAAGLPVERTLSPREERMQARDAGPERALVRNIVDARHSISSVFPILALLLIAAMIGGLPTKNPQLYNYLSYAWLAFFAVIVLEALFLARTIGVAVRERFPNTTIRMRSLKLYGIMRGVMLRKLRYPKPAIAHGESF